MKEEELQKRTDLIMGWMDTLGEEAENIIKEILEDVVEQEKQKTAKEIFDVIMGVPMMKEIGLEYRDELARAVNSGHQYILDELKPLMKKYHYEK